jgi:hypothetical protein
MQVQIAQLRDLLRGRQIEAERPDLDLAAPPLHAELKRDPIGITPQRRVPHVDAGRAGQSRDVCERGELVERFGKARALALAESFAPDLRHLCLRRGHCCEPNFGVARLGARRRRLCNARRFVIVQRQRPRQSLQSPDTRAAHAYSGLPGQRRRRSPSRSVGCQCGVTRSRGGRQWIMFA